ncbi:5-oxoprolinase subunit PxpB [Nocardioides panacisoli]|uniref:5-oxoprolinase subunit PxpB n=1 Tax=Nocardioides panacisoli TaxID=627624 RepID=UPI001C635725|nr:5-oxoprolinase subunit PxpB [Nocardioides panacisoli]QYJ05097.1 5-oxoprolinase subunit PxpB [Nocardioides panacisoli]
MQARPCGERAVLLEYDDLDAAMAAYAQVSAAPPEGVVDLVPAARTLLVHLDPALTDGPTLARALATLDTAPAPEDAGGHVEVPVVYDGEDLEDVAGLTGLSPDEVVAAHTGQTWTVAFCGFAPGFGYLVGEDDRLRVSRRTTPRTRVPTGSVALAGEFSGVYPRESPGGWQLIGRTDLTLFDLDRTPPALLTPGTRVTFVAAR